jgi:hypothetical protein
LRSIFGEADVFYFLGGKLVLYIFVEERASGAFAFDIKIKDLPHAGWYIIVPVNITATEFDLHGLFLFVVFYFMYRGRLGCEYRLHVLV